MITSACFPAWDGAHKYFILSIQWCQWNQSSFTSGCIVKVELIKTFFLLLLLLFCKTSQSRSLLVIVWMDLPVTYHFFVITSLLLFHYFRTNFASTWKNDTIQCIIKMTISTGKTLRMILLTHSSKRLSSMNQETRYNVELLKWGPIQLRCNSARIDLFMSEKSCWSQAQTKEEGIKGMRLL